MPPPYPEAWAREKPEVALGKLALRGARHCGQSYINLLTTYLGYLSLDEPTTAPREVCLGQKLTPSQLIAVAHLEASTAWWLPSSSVAAGELGRGAGRARTTLDAIARLTAAATSYQKSSEGGLGRNYSHPTCDSTRHERRRGVDSGTFKVGAMKTSSAGPVVPVVADRIAFFGKPTFDPRPLLTDRSRALYEHPQNFLIEPSGDIPVARVLASQTEFLKLLSTLDATDRLTLRFASDSDTRRLVGLQCTVRTRILTGAA